MSVSKFQMTSNRRCRVNKFKRNYFLFFTFLFPLLSIGNQLVSSASVQTILHDYLDFESIDGFPLNKNYMGVPKSSFKSSLLVGGGDESEMLNCTPPGIDDFPNDIFSQKERENGGILFHFFISLYTFYAIALICDDYFVPSIECICEQLHLPSDVAGATFMAIATSAPELFTNVIGTFVTQGDIGIGTIVGSAVFNILAVGACCGLAAKEVLQLEWWSLTRDCFFYSISVILLILILVNRRVYWYESLYLVLFYLLYILVMYYNTACKEFFENLIFGKRRISKKHLYDEIKSDSLIEPHTEKSTKSLLWNERAEEKTPLMMNDESEEGMTKEDMNGNDDLIYSDEILISKALHKTEIYAEEEEVEWGLFKLPHNEGFLKWCEWIVGWPVRCVLKMTIPDCRIGAMRKFYPLTFIMCMIWIGGLSYIVSWMMTVIGHTFGVPDSVMGLTFIAAGTSVPEAVSSVIVTRQGLGSMGISNSIGSNTFDILICLGVPWLIRSSLISSSEFNFIQINSGGLEYSTILLISSLIVFYITLALNGFKLTKRIGILALGMYLIFLIISSLFELNVFFNVNLPTCSSIQNN